MKKKKPIIWLFIAVSLIITCDCLAAEKRLNEENRISKRHQQIEYCYMNKILKVRLRAAGQIRLLEVAEISKPNWADINEWADFAGKVLRINGCECESYSLFENSTETPAERLAVALSRIAKRKSDIFSRSELEALNLENQKKHALASESSQLQMIIRENGPVKESDSMQGLVTSIVYSPEKSSAVIDRKIIHEGDVIDGVTVVKIYQDRIVFEKNRDRWEQIVRQIPKTYWK
ncbi:MAG: hypothetical protein JW837_02045 [Sedimentisphaerales bacterium]|nr:hypothetical protein [Sedimentisphaerales bacterium]